MFMRLLTERYSSLVWMENVVNATFCVCYSSPLLDSITRILFLMKDFFFFVFRCPRRRRRGQLTPEVATIPVSQEPVRDKKRKKHKTDPAAIITVSVIPVEPAEEDDPTAYDPQTVSVTSCLVVMSSFVIGGAILFSVWEVTQK
jgi:hypothetical protein